MKKYFLTLLAVFLLPISAKSEINIAIDKTTQYLMSNWKADETLKKLYPPQVLSVPTGTKVYGGCGEFMKGNHIGGSLYCPYTHTVFLDTSQLQDFYDAFGSSSIAYVIAHEFSHALQREFEINLKDPNHELQADCMAGVFIATGNKELGITRQDVLSMTQVAYSIGGKTHGSGAQRAYSLLGGMGRVDFDCKEASIQKLVDNEIQDPFLQQISRTRSDAGGMNLRPTPYPKKLKRTLGL